MGDGERYYAVAGMTVVFWKLEQSAMRCVIGFLKEAVPVTALAQLSAMQARFSCGMA
jgi:hypothetical protein